jgi:hypothetical protein
MRIYSKQLDDKEAAIRDPAKIGYFGSWEIAEETITVVPMGTLWKGDELAQEPQGTMGGSELDRKAAGY